MIWLARTEKKDTRVQVNTDLQAQDGIPTCYRLNPTSYQDHKHKTKILSPHVQQPTY